MAGFPRVFGSLSFVLALLALSAPVFGPTPAVAQEDAFGDPADGQVTAQGLVDAGRQQLEAGDFDASVGSFSQVIVAAENNGQFVPELRLLRAKAFLGAEDYQAALEDLKEAATYSNSPDKAPLQPAIQATQAEVYIELGAFDLALPLIESAVATDRNNQEYQFNLGKTQVKLGQVPQGEKTLTKWLDTAAAADAGVDDEQRAEALLLRGTAYAGLNKLEKAAGDLAAAIELDPTNHEVYFTQAQIALQDEEYETAVERLGLAIENYTPEDEDDELPFIQGHLTRAFAYEELGKEATDEATAQAGYAAMIDECNAVLEELDEDDPNVAPARASALFRRAVGQRLLGELGDAVRSFSQAIQLNPSLGEAYFRRGICFFYLGEERLAIRDFEQAASINFDSPRSNFWKGMAWAKLGEFDEAVRSYGESVAVSDRYVPAYVNRGLAHLQQQDYMKAIADFNEAIRLQPTEATHYYRRGQTYAQSGEREKAIQSYLSAIAFDDGLVPAYAALATELEANGQRALAAEYRQRAGATGL